jgi:WD40 repeat protein
MAKYTEAEEQLLKQVTDDRLVTNLAEIRQAVEDIWAPDAPRIVRDYTDHGIRHSERLAEYAVKLIKANDGQDLSSNEMYLLLAGIYLHDIGMQCDVVHFPGIKEQAVKNGACFDIAFTTKTANDYSFEEQKAIRSNHQHLTAAWIDIAFSQNDGGKSTVLDSAAQKIPEDLVDDLIDVCRYHSKLPITSCPLMFDFKPNERKRLVAALLRFSDELDIDVHRVSIETVKTFSFDPRNSIYWYLHNQTHVDFQARNMIRILIRLSPDDCKQYGSVVHRAFITEFQTKNGPVLGVLAGNGIPIVISHDSKVVDHKRAASLPPEICQAFNIISKKDNPLIELSREVETWLQAIRYEVSSARQKDVRSIDMLATLDLGTVKQRILVRCIGGEIASGDVENLVTELDRKTPQGWLISDSRVSARARKIASADDGLQVFSLAEFLRQMVWSPYIDYLQNLVVKAGIPDLYVDLGCYKQEISDKGKEPEKESYPSLDEYMDKWLGERGMMHISLLGEFGSGKTWFCRHYAYRQLEKYLKDPRNKRLPLLITLRAFTKAMTAQQLINDALLEQYKLPFVGSAFEVFQEMNRQGKLLLILDGFDEMARRVDYQTVVDNFWELASLVDENSKVILTSRTEYFRWAKESEKILGGEEFGRRTIILAPPKFEVLYLEPFSDDQIRDLIARRLGTGEGPSVANRIMENPNLAEMLRKPLLVELLLAALDEASASILEDQSMVYLYATNKLLLRNITAEKTFTSTTDKLYFLCELAWEMIKNSHLRIHYTDIPKRIKTYFGDRVKDKHELDNWDFDLRNQTLLHRDAAGYYEFAHKSLAEYFVALKFAMEIGCLANVYQETYCEADGNFCQIPYEKKPAVELADTFGFMPVTGEQMEAVRALLLKMFDKTSPDQLWRIIGETKHQTFDQVKHTGGNAASLLKINNVSFKDADLADTVLVSADLGGVNLMHSNMQNINLSGTELNPGTLLEKADLRGADFTGSSLDVSARNKALLWTRDGSRLIAGAGDGSLRVWDTVTWGESVALSGLSGEICSLLALKDGGKIILGDRGNTAILWDLDAKTEILRFKNSHGMAHQMALSPDEQFLACVDSRKKVIVFGLQSGKQIKMFEADVDLFCVAFSAEGERLIAGGTKGKIFIWEFKTGGIIRELKSFNRIVYKICHSKDQDRFVTCGVERAVECWHSRTGKQVFAIESEEPGSTLSYSSDESKFAFADWIGLTTFYDSQSGNTISQISSTGNFAMAFSPDGSHIAIGDMSGTIRIWDINEKSADFKQCVRILDYRMNCRGMQISGAKGLEQIIEWKVQGEPYKGSLLQYFSECKAVLDKEQLQLLKTIEQKKPQKT